ncbi:MAG TPA: hypothetical protein VLL52_14535 [Anaerolineae bacterium]|nr:hypothetical protein [Anaerolineae bacterium]
MTWHHAPKLTISIHTRLAGCRVPPTLTYIITSLGLLPRLPPPRPRPSP